MVTGESSHVDCVIVINKIDLDESEEYKYFSDLYSSIGYKVIETSVKKNIGLEKLRDVFCEKTNLIWGQSGVGKSSILNMVFPNLNFKIGEISEFTSKGKHTTVTSILKKIDMATAVIDTPGIREIDPYGIRKEDLGHFFLEFIPFINDCKFNTCTHHHEPGCAVIDAVEKKIISVYRYQSYLNILDTVEEDMNF